MSKTGIAAETLAAYRAARYCVLAVPEFSLLLDQRDAALSVLMAACQQTTAALLTAFNPLGVQCSVQENRRADAGLQLALRSHGLPLYPTIASDPAGRWPKEPGWLVLGLSRDDAIDIGRQFSQNAILWADADAVPRLHLLR